MRWKIIDDFRLQHLKDLFEIKLICLWSELNVASFWICMDTTFFDQKRFFIALSLYQLSFFANTPFKNLNFQSILSDFYNRVN